MSARQPSPNAQFSAFLSRFPPAIVALVKRCLPKLRRAFSGAYQLVYEYPHSLVVSFSESERGYEGSVAMAIDPRRVRLYFPKDIPDPKGRLEGSGTKVRSVTLAAASELDHGDIHGLIKAAIKRSGGTITRTRSTRMVVKSGSKRTAVKRRPTR